MFLKGENKMSARLNIFRCLIGCRYYCKQHILSYFLYEKKYSLIHFSD